MLKNNKGVTLVELLIVIVILGIIAAIAVPAVGSIVENAEKDAFLADATVIRNATNTYCQTVSGDDRTTYCPSSDKAGAVLTSSAIGTFVSGLDADADYASKLSGGAIYVALIGETYAFVGNPLDSDRSNVVENDDGFSDAAGELEDITLTQEE